MNLYIKVENEQPVDHPVFMDNLFQAFGGIPDEYKPFIRVARPEAGVYQTFDSDSPTYEFNSSIGYWWDVWSLRDMTDAEKLAKQQKVQNDWASMPDASNFTAWVFDETTCSFEPPTPRPTDGKPYFWQGTTNSWVLIPPYPDDGKQYKLDIPTATWVEST